MKRTILFFPVVFLFMAGHAQTSPDVFHAAIKTSQQKKILPSVVPALPQLIESLKAPMKADEKTDILYNIVKSYLNNLKIDSALYYAGEIKKFSDSMKYEPGLAKYQLSISGAFYFRNRDAEAMVNLEQAEKIFLRNKLTAYLGITYRQMAREFKRKNDQKNSRIYFHKAIEQFTGSEKELLLTYNDLGLSFFETYETDSAVFYLTKALELSEKIKNQIWKYNTASRLGSIYLISGDLENAGKYLKYALDNSKISFDKIQLRWNLGYYAEYFILSGEYENAENVLRQFDKLNELLGDAMGSIQEKELRGELYYAKGFYSIALQYLKEAYTHKYEIDDYKFDIKNIALHLAMAELKTGNTENAIDHLLYARNISREVKFAKDEMESDLLLSEAFRIKNKMDSAYHYFRLYSSLKDSVLTIQKERTIIEFSTKYDAEKREQEIKNLQNQKQLYAFEVQLKDKTIEQQHLLDTKKSQQLTLLSQQAEIDSLHSSEKNLALQNREKEIRKKQNELQLLRKEEELQAAIASKQNKQKQLAFVIVGGILVVGLFGLFKYRQNKKLSTQLSASLVELKQMQAQLIKAEKEKEAEDLRVRISRDIHDEVGATLSGVALFSEIAKQKMIQHQEKDAQEYLEHISVNSKEMVEKMSDIIWTINPKNDSFERILFKLQSYAMNLCAGKGIRLHFDIDEKLKHSSFAMHSRKNIYLLVKEAINNAVKYSGAANIYLCMRKENETVRIEIKDDGCGFNIGELKAGNGIANMQARAKELDGVFCIVSQPGNGTLVQLHFHPNEVVL